MQRDARFCGLPSQARRTDATSMQGLSLVYSGPLNKSFLLLFFKKDAAFYLTFATCSAETAGAALPQLLRR